LFGWYVRLLTSFSFDGLQGMHRAQISGVPHRLAPLTHDEDTLFVDMRHRSTPGVAKPSYLLRPANGTRWLPNGSNRRPPAIRQPVDEALPRARAACYLRGHRASPAPSQHLDHDSV
jgi:hypothetical protein